MWQQSNRRSQGREEELAYSKTKMISKEITYRKLRDKQRSKNQNIKPHLTLQIFQKFNTLLSESLFFKIRQEERDDINRYKQFNPPGNNIIPGCRVRNATMIGSLLSDPDITNQGLNQILPVIQSMFFSAFRIYPDDLEFFHNQLGSRIPNTKIIYICHQLPHGASNIFTVLELQNNTTTQQIQEKLNNFQETRRLIIVQKVWRIHGKLRLIKFTNMIRVCVTSSNMSFVDFNEGGNVFWKRDFTHQNNRPLGESGLDFLNTIKSFLTSATKIPINQTDQLLSHSIYQLFNLDGFYYDRLDNVRLILCPPNQRQTINLPDNNVKYGLEKIKKFLRTRRNFTNYTNRVLNVVSPFKCCYTNSQNEFSQFIIQLFSAFSGTDINENSNIPNENKLRINQMTPQQYYIANKYEGLQKRQRINTQYRNDMLKSLSFLQGEPIQSRALAFEIIESMQNIAEFHEFRRLKGLKASTTTTHHTKMILSTCTSLSDQMLGNDVVFLGSQNLAMYSWGYYQDNDIVQYKNLQLGVLIYGYSQERIEEYLPFITNTSTQHRESTYLPAVKIMNYQNDSQNNPPSRIRQLETNFNVQLAIEKNIFEYLIKAQQFFDLQFNQENMRGWSMYRYYPITARTLENEVYPINLANFQVYKNSILACTNNLQQYLQRYNQLGGFYIAEAVFLRKRGNKTILKAIMNFKGDYKISYSEDQVREMLRINKQSNEEIIFIDVDYRYLNGGNYSAWQNIVNKLANLQ